jgi:hypothetical protein
MDALCSPQPVVLGHVANQGNRLGAQASRRSGEDDSATWTGVARTSDSQLDAI